MNKFNSTQTLFDLIQTIRCCALFSGLPETDLREIAVFSSLIRLGKGEYVFRENDLSTAFYIVQNGIINVHRISASGKEQVIHYFRKGESFAEVAIANNTGYPADAMAVTPSNLVRIPKDAMLQAIRKHPDFALRMLVSMSNHLRNLVNSLDDLKLKDVESRLLYWLLKHCPDTSLDTPVVIELGMTKKILAAELGASSETLSRTLAKLRNEKLLAVKGRKIEIPSPSLLRLLLKSLQE